MYIICMLELLVIGISECWLTYITLMIILKLDLPVRTAVSSDRPRIHDISAVHVIARALADGNACVVVVPQLRLGAHTASHGQVPVRSIVWVHSISTDNLRGNRLAVCHSPVLVARVTFHMF